MHSLKFSKQTKAIFFHIPQTDKSIIKLTHMYQIYILQSQYMAIFYSNYYGIEGPKSQFSRKSQWT